MRVLNFFLTNCQNSISGHIVGMSDGKVIGLFILLNQTVIISSNSFNNCNESTFLLIGTCTPSIRRIHIIEGFIGFERVMSLVNVVVSANVKGNICIEHCWVKLLCLFVLSLTVFLWTVAFERVVRGGDYHLLFIGLFYQQLFESIGLLLLILIIVKNVISVERNERKLRQSQHSSAILDDVVRFKSPDKNLRAVCVMFVVSWCDNNGPIRSNLTDHPNKIIVSFALIWVQVISDISVDVNSFDVLCIFEKVIQRLSQRSILFVQGSHVSPVGKRNHFELFVHFRESVGNVSILIGHLGVRHVACPSKHHIFDLDTFGQIVDGTVMHIWFVWIDFDLHSVTVYFCDLCAMFLVHKVRSVAWISCIETSSQFLKWAWIDEVCSKVQSEPKRLTVVTLAAHNQNCEQKEVSLAFHLVIFIIIGPKTSIWRWKFPLMFNSFQKNLTYFIFIVLFMLFFLLFLSSRIGELLLIGYFSK